MSFEAKYPGLCAACDEGIKPGASVTYVNDQLVHARCPESRTPCLSCFMVPAANGACGCDE